MRLSQCHDTIDDTHCIQGVGVGTRLSQCHDTVDDTHHIQGVGVGTRLSQCHDTTDATHCTGCRSGYKVVTMS